MGDPVSQWERYWRSLQIFNAYRLVQMSLLACIAWFSIDSITSHNFDARALIVLAGCLHATLIALGLFLTLRWKQHFHLQLSLQVLVDIAGVMILMVCTEGVRSGIDAILLVTVAGASLMSSRRMAFFYAALTSLAVLGVTLYLNFAGMDRFDAPTLANSGFRSIVFFVAASAAYFFGQRLSLNEELAFQRGVALDDQMRVSRRVMERMGDGVLVVDAEGIIVDRNPMALAILGKNPDRVKGDLALIAPDLASAYQLWRSGGAAETEIRRPEGTDLAVSFSYTYSSGNVALVFMRDLRKLREQAMQFKLASLGQLTASIAHEIRNPLSSIRHASELLAEDIHVPAQRRLLQIVSDNVLRLDRIVQDVLVLGRQRAAEDKVDIRLADFFATFIPEIVVQENLPAGVIACDLPEEVCLNFSRGQFRQVVWNLLDNALRYASRREGAVRVFARQVEDGVELHIVDDGEGIPKAMQMHVFEPFFTTSAKGTGLGLHIARELCESNGAVLFLAQEEGEGGHFVLKGKEAMWLLRDLTA
ncbi:MAG: PAS domain-containing protein [Zoogloeaceae bacterium]|nr:PAS domain-containing protein [Zoogloeaceae bacterium]